MADALDRDRLTYWRIMTALQAHVGQFTPRLLVDIAGAEHRNAVEAYLDFLIGEKVITLAGRAAPGPRAACCYRIDNSGEAPPARRGHAGGLARQSALWTAMRNLRNFTIAELAVTASTDDMPLTEETTKDYVLALERAGYLRRDGHAPRRRRTSVYTLPAPRNTGPRPPIVQRGEDGCFDLNLMQFVNVTGSQQRAA